MKYLAFFMLIAGSVYAGDVRVDASASFQKRTIVIENPPAQLIIDQTPWPDYTPGRHVMGADIYDVIVTPSETKIIYH